MPFAAVGLGIFQSEADAQAAIEAASKPPKKATKTEDTPPVEPVVADAREAS